MDKIEQIKAYSEESACDGCPGNNLPGTCASITELGRCGQKLRRESNPDLEAEIARYEDEIHGYESTSYDGCVEIARHFAAWQKEQDEQKCHGCFDRDEVFRQGMLKGAKEKEEEMKRTAIEAKVSFGQPVLLNELIPTSLAKDGDKVKLIIIKDDGGQV